MSDNGESWMMDEAFKDKTAGLIVIGVFEILGGLFCGLFFALALISVMLIPDEVSSKQTLIGSSVYAFLSLWLIWMGIGTIRARRSARLLMLASSWIMGICGVFAMAMMLFIMPKAFAASELPAEMIAPMLVMIYIVLGVIYVVFPTIGILFYGNRNVRATFEERDPAPSWTESGPLPVLILVMVLLLGALSMMMLCFMNFALPFFGTILSGWAGAVVLLSIIGICLWLAQGVHHLKESAWWGALALLLLGVVSQVLTYSRIDVMDYYVEMGYSDQMLLQLNSMDWVNSTTFNIMAVVYAAPALVFLLFLKRYFKSRDMER